MGDEAYIELPEALERPATTRTTSASHGDGAPAVRAPAHRPAFQQLFGAIMFAPSPSRQEREMIAAVAASAQTCFY